MRVNFKKIKETAEDTIIPFMITAFVLYLISEKWTLTEKSHDFLLYLAVILFIFAMLQTVLLLIWDIIDYLRDK